MKKSLLGNGQLATLARGPLRNCMKFEDEVKGEQGLAALAFGKFEDEYEI